MRVEGQIEVAGETRARRVLVVDDSALIREIARIGLEFAGGCEMLSASSGADALQIAVAERPDAILLDVVMPGLDGPATFARLQADARTREIPVILVTAKDEERFDGLGVAGVIPKPFEAAALPAQLAAIVGWADVHD